MDQLLKVKGIGPTKIKKIEKLGIQVRKVTDILDHAEELALTNAQIFGIKIASQYNSETRYPLDFGREVFSNLKNHCGMSLRVAGSLRRKKPQGINDLDILYFSRNPEEAGIRLLKVLSSWPYIRYIAARGPTKVTAFAKYRSGNYRRARWIQIDIRIMKPESKAAALMYFTGSQAFNIVTRQKAKRLGFLLNEYGLFHRTRDSKGREVAGERIPVRTERELFAAIGMRYHRPNERSI